ncbi:uncharacterized protein PV07_08843 [Cladophialophora immunda]|uniref:AMP-dependent synthetase/ligase domain-containing protein n=1 Tax=Cladophialophora immunda TaxID=569365 RepID=A0A0D2AL00_9EURO|nr:uncharacterized protein PV07_08843 [Cladophialophora immunda]KIW25682.1 hypothetical protein PV07_08843 [Cladophialophora immunda]
MASSRAEAKPKAAIYRSNCPPTNYPTNVSLSQFLVETNPEQIQDNKVTLEDNWTRKRVTYGGIREAASKGAWGLRRTLDFQRGDVAAILCPNAVDWMVFAHSALWAGGIVGAINHLASAPELVHYLQVCSPKVVAVYRDLLPVLLEALSLMKLRRDKYPKIVSLCGRAADLPLFPDDISGSAAHEAVPPLDLTNEDSRKVPAVILFSSGTTGNPKGAYLSHHGIISHLLATRIADPDVYNGEQREVFFPPLCHLYGFNVVAIASVWLGNYTLLMKTYTFEEFIQRSSEIRCTWMHVLPPVAVRLAKSPLTQSLDLQSLRTIICSGSPLGEDLVAVLRRRAPEVVITQKYGSTEATVTFLKRSVANSRGASIGKLYPDMEARVVDDDMLDVEPGKVGELLVRGSSVFMGYKDNPTATREAFHDGWVRTGDLVRCDEEGYFYITGRKKELIKYKGFQVAPTELEEILTSHPLVQEAGVTAHYDEAQATEVPNAYITLADGTRGRQDAKVLAAEIRAYVDGKVAPYKRLRGGVVFLDTMPKTNSGKILRRLLSKAKRISTSESKL